MPELQLGRNVLYSSLVILSVIYIYYKVVSDRYRVELIASTFVITIWYMILEVSVGTNLHNIIFQALYIIMIFPIIIGFALRKDRTQGVIKYLVKNVIFVVVFSIIFILFMFIIKAISMLLIQ